MYFTNIKIVPAKTLSDVINGNDPAQTEEFLKNNTLSMSEVHCIKNKKLDKKLLEQAKSFKAKGLYYIVQDTLMAM